MKMFMGFLIMLFPSFTFAIKVIRNGGDFESLDFVDTAHKVVSYLEVEPIPGVDLEKLRKAISETKVESTEEKLFLDGTEKDAINYPTQQKIVFNSRSWKSKSEDAKPALVLHEYLGIMGVDDSRYEFSRRLIGMVLVDGIDAIYLIEIFKENQFGRVVKTGCTQNRDAVLGLIGYECFLENSTAREKLRILRGRKARELWTFLKQFGAIECDENPEGRSCRTISSQIECTHDDMGPWTLSRCHAQTKKSRD